MPYGHILDYVGDGGEVFYPTPEQCERGIPNGFGWWTPIENGAFFTGLYAYTLIKSYDAEPSEELRQKIDILIHGLFTLYDVSHREGFIARGVAEDGKSHYPISSDDQVAPWMLALYAYVHSDSCRDRDGAAQRLLRFLEVFSDSDDSVITDWEGVKHGSWASQSGWRDVVKLLFAKRIYAELTGSDTDLASFRAVAEGAPPESVYTRIEIVSHGFAPEMINSYGKQPWICVSAHLALRELRLLDPENADYYNRGIYNDAVAALPMVRGIRDFTQGNKPFCADWRGLATLWQDRGHDISAHREMANAQNRIWMKETVPSRKDEHVILGNAVYAAWIAIASDDKRIADAAYSELCRGYKEIDWDRLHLPMAYPTECALRTYNLYK